LTEHHFVNQHLEIGAAESSLFNNFIW